MTAPQNQKASNTPNTPNTPDVQELIDAAAQAVEYARKHGADDAEVIVRAGSELSAKVRKGEVELVQEAASRALGLRVFKDNRQSATYTSDLRPEALEVFVKDSVDLAGYAEADEFNRLPDASHFGADVPSMELYDESVLSVDGAGAIQRATAAEAAAFAHDERITNSDGGSWSRVTGAVAFANSAGFANGYRGSYASMVVAPIADDEDGKKRNGFWWTANRFLDALDTPENVGRIAAERTVAKLGSRKVETCEVPVVFIPDSGRDIVGMVFSVANGSSFYRKSTYLLDREGTQIASTGVTIDDDPFIPRGPGSRPFDGDGLLTRKNTIVENGILKTVLCDTYSARKLGRESTASAGRGVGGTPSPTTSNLVMHPGEITREELIAQTKRGLLVTSMMGFGFNALTGDFSRGASGFWIEDGKVTFPVSEITISANFDALLKGIDLIASDIDRRSSTMCPTFRVSSMTIAGS